MPVKKTGSGYKYGSKGKLYTGPDAKAKAKNRAEPYRHPKPVQPKMGKFCLISP